MERYRSGGQGPASAWQVWARFWLLACAAMLLQALAPASAAGEQDFLPPEQAFRFSARAAGPDALALSWTIAPGYYMYREQFRIVASEGVRLGEPEIPRGAIKYDETFAKDVETHRDAVTIRVPLAAPPQAPFTVSATSQGCADAGLCYPPTEHVLTVSVVDGGLRIDGGTDGGGWSSLLRGDDVTLADALAGGGTARTVLVFFVLGVLLALTPCVLPMVPILSSLLVGGPSGPRPRLRGLGLAALYVLGMSVVYTAAGVLAGLSGESLAARLQTPWVLGLFATLLFVLALAMFGAFSLQIPASWQSALATRAGSLPGGRALGALLMGAISALIVGPCVAAPLAGALLYISQTRDILLGGLALFALAWGMGVPLLLAGASAGTLLPKAGPWMEGVKQFFGMLLLAVAWWMLWPVLPAWLQMLGWGVLALLGATLLRAFDPLPDGAGVGRRMLKGVGVVLALAGALQWIGVAAGGRDPLAPLGFLSEDVAVSARGAAMDGAGMPAGDQWLPPGATGPGPVAAEGTSGGVQLWQPPGSRARDGASASSLAHPVFERVRSVAELDAIVAASDRPVMLDFYADWCVSCKEMEAFTFVRPAVAARMAQFRLLQADVTANDEADRALLKRFRLFGPPGIVFFDVAGRELRQRVIGFQPAERFARTLDEVLAAR